MTVNGAALLITLGLRDINPLYFVPLVALLALLLERELIRSSGGERARAAARILGFASLPLLVAFAVLTLLRINQIFSAT